MNDVTDNVASIFIASNFKESFIRFRFAMTAIFSYQYWIIAARYNSHSTVLWAHFDNMAQGMWSYIVSCLMKISRIRRLRYSSNIWFDDLRLCVTSERLKSPKAFRVAPKCWLGTHCFGNVKIEISILPNVLSVWLLSFVENWIKLLTLRFPSISCFYYYCWWL